MAGRTRDLINARALNRFQVSVANLQHVKNNSRPQAKLMAIFAELRANMV
jgi:hypothetical protein